MFHLRVLVLLLCILAPLGLSHGPVAQTRAVVDVELGQRHFRRGNTFNNLERYDEAITEYELAVTADPNLAEAYHNMASILYFGIDAAESTGARASRCGSWRRSSCRRSSCPSSGSWPTPRPKSPRSSWGQHPELINSGWADCDTPITWSMDTARLTPADATIAQTQLTADLTKWGEASGLTFQYVGEVPVVYDDTNYVVTSSVHPSERHLYLAFLKDAESTLLDTRTVGFASPTKVWKDSKEIQLDSTALSIMSYTRLLTERAATWLYPMSFMPLDFAALTQLYGASQRTGGEFTFRIGAAGSVFDYDKITRTATISGDAMTAIANTIDRLTIDASAYGAGVRIDAQWGVRRLAEHDLRMDVFNRATQEYAALSEDARSSQFSNYYNVYIDPAAKVTRIIGTSFDDILQPDEGRQELDGGAGADTLVLPYAFGHFYSLSQLSGASVITASYDVTTETGAPLRDATTFRNIEQFLFAGGVRKSYAEVMAAPVFDAVAPIGAHFLNAIYTVMYGRTADAGGVRYWSGQFGVDARAPVSRDLAHRIADGFESSQATYFNAQYGALATPDFIRTLYLNLGGNTAGVDASAIAYWEGQLAEVQGDRGKLAGEFTLAFLSYAGVDSGALQRVEQLANRVALSQAWVAASDTDAFMNARAVGDAAFQAQSRILLGLDGGGEQLQRALDKIGAVAQSDSLTPILGSSAAASTLSLADFLP